MSERYFVLKFVSAGTYYNGTRYATSTLLRAYTFTDEEMAQAKARQLAEDRFCEVVVVPIEIREVPRE